MSDTWSEDKISAYLDGELSPTERRQVESHLRKNPADRQKLAEMKRVSKEMRALPQHSLDKDLSGPIVAKLKRLTSVVEPLPEKREPVVVKKPALHAASIDWRGAAAAIVSLSALVLLALIVSPPSREATSVADADKEELRHENENMAGAPSEENENADRVMANNLAMLRKVLEDADLPAEMYADDGAIRLEFNEHSARLANRTDSVERFDPSPTIENRPVDSTNDKVVSAADQPTSFGSADAPLDIKQAQNVVPQHSFDQVLVITVDRQDEHLLALSEIENIQSGAVDASETLAMKVNNNFTQDAATHEEQEFTESNKALDAMVEDNDDVGNWSMISVSGQESQIRELIAKIDGDKSVMVDSFYNNLVLANQIENEISDQLSVDNSIQRQNDVRSKLGKLSIAAEKMMAIPAIRFESDDFVELKDEPPASDSQSNQNKQGQSDSNEHESGENSADSERVGTDTVQEIELSQTTGDDSDASQGGEVIKRLQALDNNPEDFVRYLLIIQVDSGKGTNDTANDPNPDEKEDDDEE